VSPDLVTHAVGPMIAFGAFLLVQALIVFRWVQKRDTELPELNNPARFVQALTFGAIYVVVLFAVAIARDLAGDNAIFVVAVVSGLTDVDALTLSVGQLNALGEVSGDTAWRAIFLATLANLTFKTAAAAVLGSPDLRRWICFAGIPALCAGGLILWLWP